eukprot:Pgem_evm1s3735
MINAIKFVDKVIVPKDLIEGLEYLKPNIFAYYNIDDDNNNIDIVNDSDFAHNSGIKHQKVYEHCKYLGVEVKRIEIPVADVSVLFDLFALFCFGLVWFGLVC